MAEPDPSPAPPAVPPIDSGSVAQAAVVILIACAGLIALGALALVLLLVVRTGKVGFEPVPGRERRPRARSAGRTATSPASPD